MAKFTALGGDIFAGLFTKGVSDAGFSILAHLEHGAYGVATAKMNFPKLDVRIGPHEWHPEDFRGRVNFMYCNPPCAAWSNMRNGGGDTWKDQHERLQCWRDLTNAGLVIQPDVFAVESVQQAWIRGREFLLEIADKWADAGYHVTIWLQNNMYLGVPQNRKRVFFIAHKYPLVWPKFTDPVTVAEVLRSIPPKKTLPKPPFEMDEPKKWWLKLWDGAEPYRGALRRAHEVMTPFDNNEGDYKNVPLATVKRLRSDEPAPVMLQAYMRMHPTKPRFFNWHEWLAFVGLPYDWKSSQRGADPGSRELARAVMPGVGKFLATAVKNGLRRPALDARLVTVRVVDHTNGVDDPSTYEVLSTRKPIARTKRQAPWNPKAPEPKTTKARVQSSRGDEPVRPGRQGIGAFMRECIARGDDTETVLRRTHEKFPQSKATASDVSWNKRKLRLQGGV